jgi:signal transduction histidine kinase
MGSIAIPLALLALYAISAGAEQEDTRSDEALVLQAGNFATLVDLELEHADALLKGLAASSSLGDGDLDRFEAEMHRVADVNPAEVIALTTPLGELVRTTWPRVQGKSLNKLDTPELLEIATSKRPGTTNLYRAPSGALRIAVARPVSIHGANGPVDLVLIYALETNELSNILSRAHLAAGAELLVSDRNGTIIASSGNSRARLGRPTTPMLRTYSSAQNSGIYNLATANGLKTSVAFAHSPASGFNVAITVPNDLLFEARWEMLKRILLFALMLSLPGFLLAAFANRRLSAGLRLLNQVRDPGHMKERLNPSGVLEIDSVAVSLVELVAAKAAAAAELMMANIGLEARVNAAVAERTAMAARSVHAQRMQTLGGLTGGVAHDFRNELQIVSSNAALILSDLDDKDCIERSALQLQDVVERGSSVIRRLLTYAREKVLLTTSSDVRSVLDGVVDILVHTMPAQIRVTLDVPAGLPRARADKIHLETVLLNIATNARQAMRSRGVFALTATVENILRPDDRWSGLPAGGYIRIDATDTGIGMSPETLKRAGEPFFTTKDDGTGLGLSMARSFAEQSGGGLFIASTLGQGTTVSLLLPCALDEVTVPEGEDAYDGIQPG